MSLASSYAKWRASELGRITDRLESDLLLRAAGPLVDRRVLDIGCGDGALALEFAKAGAIVTGLDSDWAMLSSAVERAKQSPFTLVRGDAEAIPCVSFAFDIVIMSTLLCLAADRARIVSEAARVLRPGGRLIIGELGAFSLWNGWRRLRGWIGASTWRNAHFFAADELTSIVRGAGLTPARVQGSVYYPPFALAARLAAPIDRRLGRYCSFGAAFLVVSGDKGD